MQYPMDAAAKTKGSYQKLADYMGLSRQAVYRWRTKGVPAERLLELEAATGIPRHVLRPDLYQPAKSDVSPSNEAAA